WQLLALLRRQLPLRRRLGGGPARLHAQPGRLALPAPTVLQLLDLRAAGRLLPFLLDLRLLLQLGLGPPELPVHAASITGSSGRPRAAHPGRPARAERRPRDSLRAPMTDELLAAVAAEHGTPTYVYDLDTVTDRFRRVE